MSPIIRTLAISALAGVVGVPAVASAAPAPAAQRGAQQLACDGLGTVTITTPPETAGDNWSAAQMSGGGHLIPVSFHYTVEDSTLGVVLDDETVSRPAGHQQQATITCAETTTATLADLLPVPPGVELPPGADPSDAVTLTFQATAIVKESR